MASDKITVPDIGDFDAVPVIEILVAEGDAVEAEAPLIVLESDKATMEVPAPAAGTVGTLHVKVGDKVSQGDAVCDFQPASEAQAGAEDGEGAEADDADADQQKADGNAVRSEDAPAYGASGSGAGSAGSEPAAGGKGGSSAPKTGGQAPPVTREARVPDIGDFDSVPVIELLVAEGDRVEAEAALIVLESDKATMEVPAPVAGTVRDLRVKVGDKLSEGDLICRLEGAEGSGDAGSDAPEGVATQTDGGASAAPGDDASTSPAAASGDDAPSAAASRDSAAASVQKSAASADPDTSGAGQGARMQPRAEPGLMPHAGPAVRRLARELGVDLAKVEGSGRKGRILAEDVQRFVKTALAGQGSGSAPAAASGLPSQPEVDFSAFGEVETIELPRIRKLSAANLHRNWLLVPHVTQTEDADITELEAFRKAESGEVKLTLLPFLIKACGEALKSFPDFNSSLSADGESLIRKRYCHIGFAADTPRGLLVPVIRDVWSKSVTELAAESAELAAKARDGKLKPDEMKGGCFSISSLGGIGGSHFTPIINAPEVAILGVSRARMQPQWDGSAFRPRLMCPLSLSYDHRVIDGAAAARFITHLKASLEDLRRLLL